MNGAFTTSMARNIFYGGTVFFFLLFLALTFDTEQTIPKQNQNAVITPEVKVGKKLWETYNCVGCHTLLGEGAYFAPELGNVVKRYGGVEGVKAFIQARPKDGIPGRRSMPQFNFTEEQLNALAAFLQYAGQIDANAWPPNIKG